MPAMPPAVLQQPQPTTQQEHTTQETMPALPSPQMLDSTQQMPAAQKGQPTTGATPGQDASATNHTVLQQDGQPQQPDQTPQAHGQNEAQQANQDVQGQVVQEAQPVQQGTNGETPGGHENIQEAVGDSQKLPEDAVAPLQVLA